MFRLHFSVNFTCFLSICRIFIFPFNLVKVVTGRVSTASSFAKSLSAARLSAITISETFMCMLLFALAFPDGLMAFPTVLPCENEDKHEQSKKNAGCDAEDSTEDATVHKDMLLEK